MSIIELEILIGYLRKVLYFISRNIRTESEPQLVAIMTRLAKAIKPIQRELLALQMEREGRHREGLTREREETLKRFDIMEDE